MKWLWPTLTAGIAANGIGLRRRVASLQELPTGNITSSAYDGHRVITAVGVRIDAATGVAAMAYAVANSLDVVDLVPADLPVARLLELVRLVDPRTYRDDPLMTGRSACHAVVVSDDVARRARIDRFENLEPAELVELAARLKRHAPRTTDLVIAPRLHALSDSAVTHAAHRRAIYGSVGAKAMAVAQATELATLARGATRRRPGPRHWGFAAATLYSLQPLIATAGTQCRPRDLVGRTVLRLPATISELARSSFAALRETDQDDDGEALEQKRKEYQEILADGVERLFEPRRLDCPLCESTDLSVRVRMHDYIQGKPGEFVLEECGTCGHVFQNPRLSLEGLDFYYRDFYDGMGEEEAEGVFSAGRKSYEGRVHLVESHTKPARWLDVGTGHGHFCLVAKGHWPDATFDGLDMTDSVDEAKRRGWISTAHRGLFPELADGLRGAYDVVSMHHYLEHTREPGAELDAAAAVLASGGFLLVELPDPSSRLGRRLGKWWIPYFQPQHQHLVSVDNLQRMLRERGFEVVAVERSEAHQPCDFTSAALLALNHLGPAREVPWMPPPTVGGTLRRAAVFTLGSPLLALGLAIDQLGSPVVARTSPNAFRVLARNG